MKKKLALLVAATLMVSSFMTACGDAETENQNVQQNQEVQDNQDAQVEDEADPVDDNSGEEGFTLLDVTTDMIDVGIYAVGEDQTELVFSMFTAPDGTPMASLFGFTTDGGGDVICGTYEGESLTDEDGIDWTLLTVSDVYSGGQYSIGFGELGEEVYIIDTADGTPYEGQYLTADDTINYMAAAVVLLAQ